MDHWFEDNFEKLQSVFSHIFQFASNARRLNIALDDKRGEEQLLYWKAAVLSLDEWTESLQVSLFFIAELYFPFYFASAQSVLKALFKQTQTVSLQPTSIRWAPVLG